MSTPSNDRPPEGWYPDPTGESAQRYWDGAAWTAHLHPAVTPAAPASAAPTSAVESEPAGPAVSPQDAPAAAPKRARRRGRIAWFTSLAGALVLVLVIGALVVFKPWEGGATADGEGFNPHFAYAEPQLDVEPDHVFTVPADYEAASVQGEQPGDYSAAVEVFYDQALALKADAAVNFVGDGISVGPKIEGIVVADVEGEILADPLHLSGSETPGWGVHDEYFLVQKLDVDGTALERPLVTRFTVERPLEAPVVSFTTDGATGTLKLDWEPVEGAEEYFVISSRLEGGSRSYSMVAQTSDTEWASAESVQDDSEFSTYDTPWVMRQNDGLRQFANSAAEIEAGRATDRTTEQFDIGVIARSGDDGSAYRGYDLLEQAGSLPYEKAYEATAQALDYGPSGNIENLDDLPRSVLFTGLDGRTRATVAAIDPEYVIEFDDYWGVPLVGRGTQLGTWARVAKTAMPDPAAAIEEYNAAALAAAPTTGMPRFTVESAPVDELAEGVAEPPATDYPVFGSNALVTHIAQHMIGQTTVIDVAEYTSKAGAPDLVDAYEEAIEQNPYVINVGAVSISGDGSKLFVQYAFDRTKAAEIQAEIADTVDEVISSVVDDGMSDADRVTALNDWLVGNAEYDDAALGESKDLVGVPGGYEYAWNASGVLVDGTGVCASYAYAFNALANAADVETVVVTGDVLAGGRHAWNKVLVDGAWRAVDVTWNDAATPNEYLLIGDDGFTDAAARDEDAAWMSDLVIGDYATD